LFTLERSQKTPTGTKLVQANSTVSS